MNSTSLAPKSNAVVTAIGAAVQDVQAGLVGTVPAHLRDAHYAGARSLGHGNQYRYAHDSPDGIVEQQYAPDPVHGREYYRPSRHGAEARAADVVARTRSVLRGDETG